MLKMIEHLKKYRWTILFIIALLFIQAICDLALPTYTAAIVDVGIQQQGIEHVTPSILRESTYENVALWMTTENQNVVSTHYSIVDADEAKAKEISGGIVTNGEVLLALDGVSGDEMEALDKIFAKAFTLSGMAGGNSPIDVRVVQSVVGKEFLKAGQDELTPQEFQDVVSGMTPKQRDSVLKMVDEKMFAVLPESMFLQAGNQAVRLEYETLGIDLASVQRRSIWSNGGWMLLIALLGTAAAVAVSFFGSTIAAKLGRDLRSKVFHKVVNFGQKEMDTFSTASLITRSTNDIQQVQQVMVMMLRMVIYAPIIGIGGVLRALRTNDSMAWVIFVGVAAVITIVISLYSLAIPRFKKMQDLIDRVNQVMRETLTGLPVIRAFCTQKREEERFDAASTTLMKTQLFVNRLMSGMMPLMMLVMNGITVLIMWTGSHGIGDGMMQVGDMMAFIQYTIQIIMAFLMISMMSVMLPRASVSANRIQQVLDTDITIVSPENEKPFDPQKQGVVEFRDVSFRYPGAEEDMLSGISFTALPGQTTAVLGGTGSGKSTLINLVPRFYDVTSGAVLVDGLDVRQVSLEGLRDRIGYVPQKGVLFTGSIAENLTFGSTDISESQVEAAARIAQAEEFVLHRDGGFESDIAQGGANVSGGQKQRLSIARAIAKKPEIFIFDDSFSALDYKTDVAVRSALKRETERATILVVAQRISTVMNAEQILVLDDGRLVGKGTHWELMESCEVYQQIATSQLSKEELSNVKR